MTIKLITLVILYLFSSFTGSMNISQGHIDANVPETNIFDEILSESIDQYLVDEYGFSEPKTEYLILRDYPTQTSLALPKYYVWISAEDKNIKSIAGAARLAAIDKEYFDVTDFVSNKKILSEGADVLFAFPIELQDRIINLSKTE